MGTPCTMPFRAMVRRWCCCTAARDSGVHTFEQQFATFSLHHRIVAPDQVGQGHTPAVPGPLSYTHMMQDTVAVLQQLNLRNVDIMGFSDGGILALMLAVRHPELVRRLVVSGVNIAPEGLTAEEREGLRAVESPRPKTVDQKLTQLWLNSPTPTELNVWRYWPRSGSRFC